MRAWLIRRPGHRRSFRRGYRKEIRRLARNGLERFPFTEFGMVTLAKYLISEGRSGQPAPWPDLPDLGRSEVRQASEEWALFGSLVPDANWPQLQAVRESTPSIRGVFPSNRDLQRLVDWVEQRNPANPAESGDGAGLELAPELIESLIVARRKRDSALPELERLLAKYHRLLLGQLHSAQPDNPLMREFWRFKVLQHQLDVDPDAALASLESLIGGPWHHEALHAVRTELERDRAVQQLPRALKEGLQTAVDPDSTLVRLRDLARPPPLLAVASATAAVALALLSFFVISRECADLALPLIRELQFHRSAPSGLHGRGGPGQRESETK